MAGVLLFLMAIAASVLGGYILHHMATSIDLACAFLVFLGAALFFVGSLIVSAIDDAQTKIVKQLKSIDARMKGTNRE